MSISKREWRSNPRGSIKYIASCKYRHFYNGMSYNGDHCMFHYRSEMKPGNYAYRGMKPVDGSIPISINKHKRWLLSEYKETPIIISRKLRYRYVNSFNLKTREKCTGSFTPLILGEYYLCFRGNQVDTPDPSWRTIKNRNSRTGSHCLHATKDGRSKKRRQKKNLKNAYVQVRINDSKV